MFIKKDERNVFSFIVGKEFKEDVVFYNILLRVGCLSERLSIFYSGFEQRTYAKIFFKIPRYNYTSRNVFGFKDPYIIEKVTQRGCLRDIRKIILESKADPVVTSIRDYRKDWHSPDLIFTLRFKIECSYCNNMSMYFSDTHEEMVCTECEEKITKLKEQVF